MNLQGRNLTHGLTGTDVAELQTELARLGYTIPAAEQQGSSFGAGSLAAVEQFQTAQALPSTGIVDAATASALNAVVLASTYVVKGTVSSPVSASVTGLVVQLVDKNVGGDVTLASGQTGPVGAYSISVVISPSSLKERNKTEPDLQVRVLNGTTFLATSTVQYNSPLNVTLNVSLPSNAAGLASEYELLTASIAALYKGQLSALQEGAERQDITFLANKSGWDARAVALAALADQFSQITVPAPTLATQPPPAPATSAAATTAPAAPAPVTPAPVAPAPVAPVTAAPATVSLRPEFYYALFRAGLPADVNSLFRTPSQSVQAIWQQAITQGVIPQALASQVPAALQNYQRLAAVTLLTATPLVGVSTLSAMLTVSKLNAAQQATFSQLYAQYSGDLTAFWTNVSKTFGAAVSTELQLDGQLFSLSLNNAPLVSALYTAEASAGELTSPVNLATRGYYDAAKWTPLIGTSVPKEIPGQSVDDYAQLLAAQVRLSFPTAVAADQVKRGIFPLSDATAAAGVVDFLTANYSQFAIGAEPVEAFIARNNIPGVLPAVVAQIKRLQRVYQLTPDDQTMAALLRHNLDSAYAITRYDSAGFQRAFQAELGGADNAAVTYARARHIYSAVLNLAIGYLAARQGPTLGGNATILSSFPPAPPPAPSNPAYPVIASPTLESLFGSLDYCTCEDCQSILSPAAYLVDLLHYLDQPSPTPPYENPQAVLFQRRPDLQYLPLTCANTNTALPYIDVANETLEYYVANQLSLTNFQGYSTDDTVTSADLLANPQFVNDAAYATLQGAFFPPPLPFNRPLAQLRLLFQNMGVGLPDVMAALRIGSSTTIAQTGSGYGAGDVLIEQLGMSRDEYRIFTDITLSGLYEYSGSDAAALAILQTISLQDFSRRTGVSYTDLVSILETQFINPHAILIERLERLNVPFSTLQALNSNTATAFKAGLPAGLDARAYGGSTPTDYDAVVQWVTNAANLARIMDIITLFNPTNSADQCSGASFQFRYTNGNKLTETDFVKLIRFIRLWQKLGLSIEQTDDILAALYPTGYLPTGTNERANLPLLDAGFKIMLLRIGTLFQVMRGLSLTANQSLGSLLACWDPIETVGGNALYQEMFGGPTLQREDPGAPIATVGGGPNAGDTFITTINSVRISQTVAPGDTTATVATKIAEQINSTTTTDQTTGLDLYQRIAASSQNAVITIRAGFTLACSVSRGATESFMASATANVAGNITPNDRLTATINAVAIPYTVVQGDTLATIAAKIASAINATTTISPDPVSKPALNTLVKATSSPGVVTISSLTSAGFTLACSVSHGATETFTAPLSPLSQSATVTGNITPGDTLTATINTIAIPYTVQQGDTLASIAENIADAINNTASPDPYSGLPLNSLLVAWSSAGVVTINSVNSGAPLALTCSLTQGFTGSYIAAAQVPAYQTAAIGGTVASGDMLTTIINTTSIPCPVTSQTSAAAVAASVVTVINETATPDPASGMPLNSIVHATSNGGIVTITASDPATAITLTCVATGAMTYTSAGPFPTSQTATVTGAFAPGGVLTTTINGVTLSYTVVAGDTPTTIATNIANAINAAANVDPITNIALNQLVKAGAAGGVITITALSVTGGFSLTVSVSSGTYIAGVQPPPFADNGYGDFLVDRSQTLFGHEPVLRAAFNLTGAEFTVIADNLQFTPSTPLTLNNISSIYRVGWFAHTLGLSVAEFLLLRQMTGLDPFAPLDPNPAPPVEPPVVRFIRLVQALSAAGLRPVQALYLLWNQDISGKSSPDISVITGLAFALRAAFSAVAAQFTIQTDPDGTIAKSLMALVYGNQATDFYFGLLNNTLVSAISYPNNYTPPQSSPGQPVLDASGGRLSYDNLRKQLSFAGVLDATTYATIAAAITANGNVQALSQALADLALANQQMVGPFFATYPELLPLYVAYASSTDPVQQKRTTLLANFLPSLIQKRNQEQALATVTASAGTDPSFANALLDDATILHSAADATAPVVSDLTALNMPELAAQIFFSNRPSVSPDIVLDADPVSYAPSTIGAQQTATVSGKVTAGNVLTTVINGAGAAVPYTVAPGDLTAANVAAGIALAINSAVTPDPFSGLPLADVVTATATGGVITVQARNSGAGVSLNCLVTPASSTPPTYTAGPQVPASQAATVVANTITVGNVLTTTINTIAIPYPVVASDTSAAILAAHIAAAINATATTDPASGLPLNQVVSASSAAGVVTVTASSFGPDFTLTCSPSAGATETYTPGPQANASQSATLLGLPPANDVMITTINSVAVQYTVAPSDTTLAGLAANIAAEINTTTTVDSVTNKALNTIVTASAADAVITIETIFPGVPFTLSCSLSLGAYTLDSQVAIWQSAIVAGGITQGDTLSTTINGVTIPYTVTGSDVSLSALAGNIAAEVNATVNTTAELSGVVSATSVGGIITFSVLGSSAFTLTCSASQEATESYSTGPQFPAWQATVSGGFSSGDVLTTNINDALVAYTIGSTSGAPDTSPAAIAANIVTAINSSTVIDPVTSLRVNGLVVAASAGGIITFRSAGSAFVISCSISAGATENYAIGGELPASPKGTPIAGIWSGYLNAPQDGFYNIEVETDPGATVELSIGATAVAMTPSSNGSVWANQGPILLTAGKLAAIELTVQNLQSALTLNWQSAGLGWQTVPAVNLYSDTLVDRLQTAYIRFLKATSLATALSLTSDEIAFLGTGTGFGVSTTDTDKLIHPGTVTFTPASMVNIHQGSMLVIDSGPAQEIVTVEAIAPVTAPTTFTAVTVNPHDGTVAPFPIVDLPNASTGNGWLNFVPVSPIAGSATAALRLIAAYTAGTQTFASQTATITGTIKPGDVLTTTVNGVITTYPVTTSDTSVAILAGNIAAAINANTNPDPSSGLPLNRVIAAANSGAVITVTAVVFGPDFTMSCSVSTGATESYTPGPPIPASQTVTLSGVLPANYMVVTTLNSVAVQYTVVASDTTTATLAANVVKAINATTTVDSITNLPLYRLVKASNAGGVITMTAISPGAPLALSCSIASLRGVLIDLLNFARIKAAVSPNDEQLLDILENPNLLSADGVTPQIVKVTGWTLSSLYSLLQHFFGTTQLSSLSSIESLRQVFDAFAFVTTSRLSATALLAATTNAPTPATVASLQSALRALYAGSDWLNIIRPINDAMRIQRRDALVAYILQQLGDTYGNGPITRQTTADAPAGSTTLTFASVAGLLANMGVQGLNIPSDATISAVGASSVTLSMAVSADVPAGSSLVFVPLNITTADDLFEFFLIDVETQPPVETSRIRLALSSVQLFVERVLRNLEPQVLSTDIDGSLWTWMKRYRVWQANREVFLWPENWLYPELRDDQSPFFQQMMSALLQSDITDDAATGAYLDYLSNLELVAKLEPCGLYYVPATGDADEASYVVARTAGAHRKYYFRQLQYGSWTPWTEIQIDCEDMPVNPIVWNGRLLLFWLKITKTTTPKSTPPSTSFSSSGDNSSQTITKLSLDDFQQFGAAGVSQQKTNNVNVSAILCWSEYYNEKWQPQKSSDVNRPTFIGTFDTNGQNSFDGDRNLWQIVPTSIASEYVVTLGEVGSVQSTIPPDALVLGISSPLYPSSVGGFVLYNTHSLPVRWDDIQLSVSYTFAPIEGGGGHTSSWSPLASQIVPPYPGRTLAPISYYTGGSSPPNGDPFNISYWRTLAGNPISWPPTTSPVYKLPIFGLTRVPRTVNSAPNSASNSVGWDAPFFFEDRRNVFYVTTTESQTMFDAGESYGNIGNSAYDDASSRNISRLVLNDPAPTAETAPFATGFIGGGGASTAVARFVAQNGVIRAALGSSAPVAYQGTTLYPSGQALEQAAPSQPTAQTVPKQST